MTVAPPAPASVDVGSSERKRPFGVAGSPVVLAAVLAGAGLAVRGIGLVRGFELWVDEMLYADLGASMGRGEMPRLADGPFFLHPPGFFLLEGAVIRLLRLPTRDSMDLVYDLRWLTAVLGALTVGLVYLLVRRVAGAWPAAWAAAVLALEPFVLRINSRVFLETLAGLAVVAGTLVLVRHLQLGPDRLRRGATVRLLAAGLLLGYAVFTKDVFALFGLLPILLAVIWRRTLLPREAGVVLAGAVVPYAVYLTVVGATGYLGEWTRAKVAGLLRLVGAERSTGFNAPGAPSLVERLVAQGEHYGTSYVILLLCPLAGMVCCTSAHPERRLVGLAAVTAGVYGAYMVAFGAAEEQYAYPIMIAGVIAMAVMARTVLDRRWTLRKVTVPLLALFLVGELTLGILQETGRDDSLLRFRQWAAHHLPATARVGATNDTSGYALADDPRFGPWATAALLKAHGAQYVLTFDLPTRQGYTLARPELLDWLAAHATPIFRSSGPTNGNTVLWYIDARELAVAAATGVGGPSRSTG